MSEKEKFILLQALVFSLFVVIITKMIPLRLYFSLLKSKKVDYYNAEEETDKKIIVQTLRRISKNVPWNVNCLNKTIVEKALFDRYRIKNTVVLSVYKKDTQLVSAHAFLINRNSAEKSQFKNANICHLYIH